jgi:two-component system LytT family response regulator
MRVLIVDDEPLARTALARILTARADVEAFDVAADAIEARERLESSSYDVMLLDVSMPELTGLELLAQLPQRERLMPSVVFVTAHVEHALAAFDRHAVDYVVKPFSGERMNQALDFASRRNTTERAARLLELLPQLGAIRQPAPKIGISSQGRIVFVAPSEIAVVEAEGNYVLLHRNTGSDLLRAPITAVAEKLEGYGFIRIHRSVLVNASLVQDVCPSSMGDYHLRLKDGREYTVSRLYKKNLRSLASSWIGKDPP